jgi:UDP-glucose 4-epimerase
MDLADAHSRAVQYLLGGGASTAVNLGTGTGTTVRELLEAIASISGRPFRVDYAERREGDSPALVADNEKARQTLGWAPTHDLASIIRTAWNWHSRVNLGSP